MLEVEEYFSSGVEILGCKEVQILFKIFTSYWGKGKDLKLSLCEGKIIV